MVSCPCGFCLSSELFDLVALSLGPFSTVWAMRIRCVDRYCFRGRRSIRDRKVLLRRLDPGTPLSAELADDGEEYRRQEDAEHGHANHACKDRRPKGTAHLGAGSLGDDQRQHAEDE